MMRLNNKGQSLVLFILLIPLILGIMALVFDLGNALTKKNEIDNVIEMVLESELKNTYRDDTLEDNDNTNEDNIIEEDNIIDATNDISIEDNTLTSNNNDTRLENIEVLLSYNLKDIETSVSIKDNTVEVKAATYVEGIFSNILSIRGFKVVSEYRGNLESKVIEKIK